MELDAMMTEYQKNGDFRSYVDAYCKKHKLKTEEALRHRLVQNVYLAYTRK